MDARLCTRIAHACDCRRSPGQRSELTTPEFERCPTYTKKDFPIANVRRFLEPGPIVLVSSAHKGETNIMTMGWHMIMEFSALADRLLHLERQPQL